MIQYSIKEISLYNIDRSIAFLENSWLGNELWLTDAAKELNKYYKQLRNDIRENANFWCGSQYCKRLSYHYYNLACYYGELYTKYRLHLEIVRKHLKKCLENLVEVTPEDYCSDTKLLKNDADKFLREVEKIFEQQKNRLSKPQCCDEKKQQNIQLLWIIDMLEDTLSVPEYKEIFIIAERSHYLVRAYHLAGQFSLSSRYIKTTENLIKKFINPKKVEQHICEKQFIKTIINEEIINHKNNLIEVKNYIEEKFQKSLDSIDNIYIEKKYIKCCSKYWLTEIVETLNNFISNKNRDFIQQIFNSLDTLQNLNDIPNLFQQLQYYKLLIEHYKFVSKEDEKDLLTQFKKHCLEQIITYSDSAKRELDFLEIFSNFLNNSRNLQFIIAELELEKFCHNELSFDKFLKKILQLKENDYGENLIALQEAIKYLQQEEDLFLIAKFKEIIRAYIKLIEIKERKIDDRLVIEIIGKNIVTSQILQQLENNLSRNSNIEEVRFVGADIMHIDADFQDKVWIGKNIVVVTEIIKIYNEVVWDVSGIDNYNIYTSNAGTEKNGYGKQGKDGYPGESGGNILILTKNIENPENFTIISNGGKGSKGQDGGKGRDGKNAKGYAKDEFLTRFPPPADFGSGSICREYVIKTILTNINKDSSEVKTVWYTGSNYATIERIINDIDEISKELMESAKFSSDSDTFPLTKIFDENIFIEAVTNQGSNITFSFERGGGLTTRQAFLFYTGSLGEAGKSGGEYGLGGQGGHPGEINVKNRVNGQEFNIIRRAKQGEDGENGQNGLPGKHGENSLDMGYLDYKWWGKYKFRGNGKYALNYYKDSNSDRVWCPYMKKYAGIVPINIEHNKVVKSERKRNVGKRYDRQHHAQALRKKNISKNSILTNYSYRFVEKDVLQNMQSDLESIKQQALQEIKESKKQQKKRTKELRVKRHFLKNNSYNDIISVTPNTTYKEIISVEKLISKLQNDLSLNNWSHFKDRPLTLPQLNWLFPIFESLKKNFTEIKSSQNDAGNNTLQDIQNLFINKYRFATLQEIAKQLSSYQNMDKNNESIQLSTDEKYIKLKEQREKEDNMYTQILTEIDSFEEKQQFDDYLEKRTFLSEKTDEGFEQFDFYNNQNCDEEDIREIVKYFPEEEQQRLKERLKIITFQPIKQERLLQNVLKRFNSEERHISSQELCFFINSILSFCMENGKEQNTFCWIVTAYSQENWIDELILLYLENYFKEPLIDKSKWREYLSQIKNKEILLLFTVKFDQYKLDNSISIQFIENTLYLLSNIQNETIGLEELDLSEWIYALKETYWTCKLSTLVKWQKNQLSTASYYLLSIENIFGTSIVEKFLEVLEKKKEKLSSNILIDILSNFHNEKWNLNKEELIILSKSYNISEWITKMRQISANKKERNITQLVKLITDNDISKKICNSLSRIESSIKSICRKEYAIGIEHTTKSIHEFTEMDIENWVKEFQDNYIKKQNIEETHEEMLAVIDRAIKLKRGFELRDTQKLTILVLLKNCNTLAQVSTGEGKSLIVVATSIMKALYGEIVDIVTSSTVLAKRDAEENKDIYNLFGINVSHNCSEDIEKRKEAYSCNKVVYGDLSNFQRDHLLDKFYRKNILGGRNFKNVIVDEVDSMLLDKGNNMLYLSHDLAGLNMLESVYIYIWQWMNRPVRNYEESSYAFNIDAIKNAVLNDLYGVLKIEDIGKLDSKLSKQQQNTIWKRLITAKILDDQGKLLKENINNNELNKLLSPEFNEYKDRLDYLLKECIEREKYIHVPNYLRPFIEQHLESWINNAVTAFFMRAGQDYVVDVDRTRTSPDNNPNIIILDVDTGTDQANSQWDEALHQFLQLKHGCKLSLQSLRAVFISNVSFFKLYSNLYGLTGTLGFQKERDLLQQIYAVDFVTIPTAKYKQFREDKPILCISKEIWIDHIYNETKKQIYEKQRSVLIICETVNEVETLYKTFDGRNVKNVHTYTRDYEEFEVAKGSKELQQGQIIIATNLAGRGTDIKITQELKKAGGLHVCLTYLPKNVRIEQQAFGRVARSGDKGSGQLIIMDTKGQKYSNIKILDLKKQRDAKELCRVCYIKVYYETQIAFEEDCFKEFKIQYERLHTMLSDSFTNNTTLPNLKNKTELKEILLQSCLDRWVFWLDKNNKQIKNTKDGQNCFSNSLTKFLSQLKIFKFNSVEDLLIWVEGNPFQMIKLGKYLSENEEFETAIRMFNKVIDQEPYFSEAAHYYKAYVLTKKIDWEDKSLKLKDKIVLKKLKEELLETTKLLDQHIKFSTNAAGIIGKIKIKNDKSIIQIDAYETQQKNLSSLYYIFSQSIDDILGHFVTPQSLVNNNISEEEAEVIYNDLLEKGILKKLRVKKSISEKELNLISSGYGVLVEILNNFFSNYKGKNINEKEFQKALKRDVQLPSREAFWKLLIDQKILNEEIKYVIVDNEKLREVDSSLFNFISTKIHNEELEMQTLKSNNKNIFLHAEYITIKKNDIAIFKKYDFIKIVGKEKYLKLKKKRTLSFNREAHIDKDKIKFVSFPCYDCITVKDFIKVNITEDEAKKILTQLVKKEIIEKDSSDSNTYKLKIKFDKIEEMNLSFCPVYENAVKELLSACFTYRIALQKIEEKLEEEDFPIRLQLTTKPHHRLMMELWEQKIVKPVTVAKMNKDLIEETIKNILHKLQLTKKDEIQSIVMILEQSKGLLKSFEVPHSKLKPFIELCDQDEFANVEEIHLFLLNGLDRVLKLEEKRWTIKMLLNTAVVAALGICQIVIGVVIQLYSVGVMTHVGGAFINEGVNDIMFAVDALNSGYFSWKNYRQQKLQSLFITAASAGIGAFLSRGTKVSRFGHKLAGPSLKVNNKKVAELSGSALIKVVGYEQVKKEVIKCIASKAIEGVVFSLANAEIDKLINKHLRTLCESISSEILSDIEQKVQNHKISISLENAYRTLGEENARKKINNLTKTASTDKNYMDQFLSIANKITSSITRGITEAIQKSSKTNNKLQFPINAISKTVLWLERFAHIVNIRMITDSFLDNLNRKIIIELNNKSGQKQISEQDYGSFKTEMINQWKLILRKNAGQIIKEHIIGPILKEGANRLLRYAGNKIQECYHAYKENEYSRNFDELKKQYQKDLEKVNKQQHSNPSQVKNHITKQYHKDLQKIMVKTRNPNLLAIIIKENVPMDMVCVNACTHVVHKILEKQGIAIPGLTIIVQQDGGIKQEFASKPGETKGLTIKINLKDNHFQLSGSKAVNKNENVELKNNCLYEALLEAIPKLKNMTPEAFRTEVANFIEQNQEIQYHIKQGWHELPVSLGGYGGATNRDFSNVVPDPESSSTCEPGEEYPYRIRNTSSHLQDRFTRYIRLGGIIQRISNKENINRNEVVKPGASKFQDQTSKRGKNIHAAHVVRIGGINSKIGTNKQYKQGKSSSTYNELRNYIGHTQNVQKNINQWNTIGGDIDRIQSKSLQKLADIDFSENISKKDIAIIESIKADYIAALNKEIDRKGIKDDVKLELKQTLTNFQNMDIKKVFEEGNKGYTAVYSEEYQKGMKNPYK